MRTLVRNSHKPVSEILLLLNQRLDSLIRSVLLSTAPTLVAEGNYV